MKVGMLEIRGFCCRYGKVSAVLGLSLDVKEGELVSLIGANGAGKTTTLKAVSGLLSNIEGRSGFWERSSRAPPLGQSSIRASPTVRKEGGGVPVPSMRLEHGPAITKKGFLRRMEFYAHCGLEALGASHESI
jgi:energy-coupling factor transporter ATP-binding protein EcfA2